MGVRTPDLVVPDPQPAGFAAEADPFAIHTGGDRHLADAGSNRLAASLTDCFRDERTGVDGKGDSSAPASHACGEQGEQLVAGDEPAGLVDRSQPVGVRVVGGPEIGPGRPNGVAQLRAGDGCRLATPAGKAPVAVAV